MESELVFEGAEWDRFLSR